MSKTALSLILPKAGNDQFLSLVRPVSDGVKHSRESSPERSTSCPAKVYLRNLQGAGQRGMEAKLRLALKLLGLRWDEIHWSGLTAEIVLAMRALMLEKLYAPATINATLSALKGVARAAWDLGQMRDGAFLRIQKIKGVRGRRLPRGRALSVKEIGRLLKSCAKDESAAGARDLCLVMLPGLRRSECAGLDLADWNEEQHALKVRGKGDKERLVYLESPLARRALESWLHYRGDAAGPLLCPVSKSGQVTLRRLSSQAVYGAINKRAKAARLGHLTPHDMRYTFGTRLLEKGADPLLVQQLLGHSSMATTGIYDRRGEDAKRKASGLINEVD
jgi:site-specific recombinase XerD